MTGLLAAAALVWASAAPPPGLDVPAGATVTLPRGRTVGPIRLHDGARLVGSSGSELSSDLPGPLVEATGTVHLAHLTLQARAGQMGVRARGGALWLTDVRILGAGEGPAVLVAGGRARIAGSRFEGFDEGLLAREARVAVQNSDFERLRRGGIALIRSTGTLSHNRLVGPFDDAALSALGCPRVELTGNRVSVAGAMGIKILGSHATLSNDRVSGARADPRGR
ncbi:MAG: right-handed parallel beta-helix repeat-containing protein, partial [Deltaproteobacteria bacterium]